MAFGTNGRAAAFEKVAAVASTTEFITPEIAAKMLNANTSNRKVISSHLRRMEATFRAHEMKLNGESIKVSSSGVILDGQHRLMACANTGIGFWTLVVRNLPDDVFDTIDQTRAPRRLSCVFSMSGEANAKTLSAALLQLNVFKGTQGNFYDGRGAGWRHHLTAHSALQLLGKHPRLRDSVSAVQVKSNYIWRTSTPSVLHYLFSIVDSNLADDFLRVLIRGSDRKDRPFNKLRESLIRGKMVGNMSTRHDAARAIKAFNYEASGVNPKLLVWPSNHEYPQISGLEVESL